MTDAFGVWQRTHVELADAHLKPNATDVTEWMLGLLPLAIFIAWGSWWALVVAFLWWRLLIPQWGIPNYLRWEQPHD